MRAGLQGLLLSPNFLYRIERGAPPAGGGSGFWQYTSSEVATRLSYFLTNSTPDATLLDLADQNGLQTQGGDPGAGRSPARHRRGAGVRRQLRQRALSAPDHRVAREGSEVHRIHARAADGDDAGDSGDVSVDRLRSKRERPRSPDHPEHVRHQGAGRAVRAADDGALVDGADRDDAPGGWTARGAPDHGRRSCRCTRTRKRGRPPSAGSSFARRSSARPIPLPPPNVSTVLPDPPAGVVYTKRQRLAMHESQASCAVCHKMMDPLGLTLENFDAIGKYRSTDQGQPIDVSGDLDGTKLQRTGRAGADAGGPARGGGLPGAEHVPLRDRPRRDGDGAAGARRAQVDASGPAVITCAI